MLAVFLDCLLGGFLVLSALAKLGSPRDNAPTVFAWIGFPPSIQLIATIGLSIVELSIGAALFVPALAAAAAGMAAALVAASTLAMRLANYRGFQGDCGCFGGIIKRSDPTLQFCLSVGLIACALVGAVLTGSLARFDVATSFMGGLAAIGAFIGYMVLTDVAVFGTLQRGGTQ